MLSYFGCDQSQVQRYLTAKSVDEGRHSLMMSAFVKIPLQALVLLTGVLVFVFYLFNQPPMLFNPVHAEKVRAERARGGVPGSSSRSSRRRSRRAAPPPTALADGRRRRDDAAARATFDAANAAMTATSARRAAQLVREITGDESYKDVTGDTPSAGRQLRLSDVRHDEAADRPRRVDHRRDLRGGDVEHRGGAQLARDVDASSTSTGGC